MFRVYLLCHSQKRFIAVWSAVRHSSFARVKVACRYNRFLLDIGRSDKVLYSYSRVTDCRKHFGSKGYCRALCIYLRFESWKNIYRTFAELLKSKFHCTSITKVL